MVSVPSHMVVASTDSGMVKRLRVVAMVSRGGHLWMVIMVVSIIRVIMIWIVLPWMMLMVPPMLMVVVSSSACRCYR